MEKVENGNGIEGKKPRPIGAMSFDTQELYKVLAKYEGKHGAVIPYSELSAVIGRNVQHEARGNLTSARRMALREKKMNFGTISGIGIKLLNDEERVALGEARIVHMRRTARKGIIDVGSVEEYDAMPPAARMKHQTYITVFKFAEFATKGKQVDAIQAAVEKTQKLLPLKDTLKMFDGK